MTLVTDAGLSITARLDARGAADIVVVTAIGDTWTAGRCREGVARRAAALAHLGVRPGDRVATLQALSPEALLTWWAIDRLGAVYLPLNPGWTPRLAGRVLRDRAPVLLVADDGQRGSADSWADASAGPVPVVPSAALDGSAGTVPVVPSAALDGSAAALEPGVRGPAGGMPVVSSTMLHDDLADCAIVHNSGLPGIHHGVRTSPRMLATMSAGMAGSLFPGARVLVAAPTCFTGTLLTVYGAIASGGSVALLPGLTAETFWPAIRAAEVTSASMINPTVADLLAQPASDADREHPLRTVGAPPSQHALNARAVERFGVQWLAGLGKTEVCGAVVTGLNPGPDEGVGRVRPPFEGRVVNSAGEPVEVDEPGELVLRSTVPGALPLGYADDAAASAHLWRGGWMHTGWHVRQDAAGNIHTVGDASIHPIVVKRAGYLFAADLEAEIVDLGTGVTAARISTHPGAGPLDDPLVTAEVAGEGLDLAVLRAELKAGLPAHLVPDDLVPVHQNGGGSSESSRLGRFQGEPRRGGVGGGSAV